MAGRRSRNDWQTTTGDTGSWPPSSQTSASSPPAASLAATPMHIARMPVQRRPAPTTRPLLAVDREGERQDRHPATDRTRSPALQQWISNDRRIRALLDQIRKVDAKAADLLLKEAVSG